METTESDSYVKIVYKLSSSSGKVGYDCDVKVSKGTDEKEMEALANLALKTAREIRDRLWNQQCLEDMEGHGSLDADSFH